MNVLLAALGSNSNPADNAALTWIGDVAALNDGISHVATLSLPSVWDECFHPLAVALEEPWDAVICLATRPGQMVMIERIAVNECDVACKDSLGRRSRQKEIAPQGEPGYWTGLPFRDLSLRLSEAGVPAVASHNPGGQLGNFVFYSLMNRLARRGSSTIGGLIHLPQVFGISDLPRDAGSRFCHCLLDTLRRTKQADSLTFDVERLKQLRVSREP